MMEQLSKYTDNQSIVSLCVKYISIKINLICHINKNKMGKIKSPHLGFHEKFDNIQLPFNKGKKKPLRKLKMEINDYKKPTVTITLNSEIQKLSL